jgi:PadR family transcriptional regulator AphA
MTDNDVELPIHAYVVLGMVGLGSRSGYEIKQDVERSIRFFWTISQAQIYPSLERLESDGLIVGHDEPTGRRRRRVFGITDLGRATLRAWLADPEPIPFELRDVGLLKLFFADASQDAEAGELLDAVSRRSQERVAALTAIRPAAADLRGQGNVYPLLTLEMGIAFHQAMADVCTRFAADIDPRYRNPRARHR